ncbi:cobalt-precorrin-6A reductase [Thiohalocapsa marina]|uniref:cobalt-precorrin-6A reductase n=1 Tax=Thiohalocapsa marina TaxID=424902 RepID=UPI0036DF762F
MNRNILILGGTTEAYRLAEALALRAGLRGVTSLAGRTSQPRLPAGESRIGGFGGSAGLRAYLREQGIQGVVDATHPFAATMGWNAQRGCAAAGVPLLRLERPPWVAAPEDRWESVADWEQAVAALRCGGARRVFLAVGRQDLGPFAALDDTWFLVRAVTPPDPMPPLHACRLLLARGPFDLEGERALLRHHRIDALVCKNSGGDATQAKLVAARELGVRVIMRRRPERPVLPAASSVEAAVAWVEALL